MKKASSSLNMKAIGRRVHELRLMRQYTQRALGEMVAVSANHIGSIERGMGNPSIQTMYDIARALDVSVDYILTGNNPSELNSDEFLSVPTTTIRRQRDHLMSTVILFDSLLDQDN